MINLHNIRLTDVVLFEQESIPIDQNNGLVIIQGMNYDSDEPDNTNGAGKSLAFSALANIRFESTPISNKKKSKKEVLLGKKSSIGIEYTASDNNKYLVEQFPGSYSVCINDNDQSIAKQEVAKKFLETTFPISEHEFYSTCYVQNLKPLYFQVETDTNRLKFVTDVFELEVYDRIRKHMSVKKGEIKDKEIEYTTLAGQLDACLQQLKRLDWNPDSTKRAKTLSSDIKELKSKLSRLYKKQQKIESLLDDIDDLKILQKKITKLKKQLPDRKNLKDYLERQASLHVEYAKYSDRKENYDQLSSSITERIALLKEELGDTPLVDIDVLRKKYDTVDNKLDSIEGKLKKARKHNALLKETREALDDQKESLKKYGYKSAKAVPKDADGFDLSLASHTIRIAENLEHHEHAGGEKCPTCDSTIDVDSILSLADKAREQLKKHANLIKAIAHATEIKALVKMLNGWEGPIDTVGLKDTEKKLQKKLKAIEQQGKLVKDWNHQQEMLGQLTKPKRPKQNPSSNHNADEVEALLDTLDKLTSTRKELATLEKRFDGIDIGDIDGESAKLIKKIDGYNSTLDEAQDQYSAISIKKREYEVLFAQQTQLESKLKKIKPIIKQKKLIEYLYKMYGATEFKLQAAAQILKLLESALNQYSGLIFPEKVKFKLEPSSRGISATYRTSKNGIWADIRHMSGAERNCFRLLFVVALLPMIPESRRTNFIVLDEPDAACSAAVRRRMIEDFLPKLRQIVPHIFWITPKPANVFKDAEVWVVEKRDGKSTININ